MIDDTLGDVPLLVRVNVPFDRYAWGGAPLGDLAKVRLGLGGAGDMALAVDGGGGAPFHHREEGELCLQVCGERGGYGQHHLGEPGPVERDEKPLQAATIALKLDRTIAGWHGYRFGVWGEGPLRGGCLAPAAKTGL